jgi:glycosyltransferase involved in cell wall biosynthesis
VFIFATGVEPDFVIPAVNILFIHQNFPAQFVHVAQALSAQGHRVVALSITGRKIAGVEVINYHLKAPNPVSSVGLARDFETKVARASACMQAMVALQGKGFSPDLIVAHPGWGEAMFCKDVWPQAKLVIFAEFYYSTQGADYNFDKEFQGDSVLARAALRVKNSVHLHAFEQADLIYSPTHWQRSQLPAVYQHKAHVMFDGIDTDQAKPDPTAQLTLSRQNIVVRPGDEIITFVNRNLEPYRGFHSFMRALVPILKERPHARCLIVGRDDVSYGSRPPGGGTWREHMLKEVGPQLPMDRMHFLGGLPYEQYLKVLQVSACHVYLTYPFVLSWSCLEAMSVECPLVASDTQPVREVVSHDKSGVLVDFFDTDQIRQAVVDMLENPKKARALGKNARLSVVDQYDLRAKCLQGQIDLILSIVQ